MRFEGDSHRICLLGLVLALSSASGFARADDAPARGLDWQVDEAPAGPVVTWLRGARDGVLGLLDDVTDAQLGLFSEAAIDVGALLELGSDGVGLVDDNPVSEHVLKGTASKSLAKTAWLFHLAGSEALLGSHGLETESWVAESLDELNPLLDPDEAPARLPLEPIAFVGEGLLHTEVYAAHVPGSILLASAAADLVIRPIGNIVRIVGFHGTADRIEAAGNGLVRRTLH
jgi:hypothetical protein